VKGGERAAVFGGMPMALIKALIPGFVLTWIVSLVIGSHGTRGGVLAIQHSYIEGYDFYWSWPLFIAATALAWAIFSMMD
jgi:hypothetical protein